MSYSVKITKNAYKELDGLGNEIKQRVINKLKSIKENPLHFCERLVGYGLYKLRVGDYRIILDILQNEMLIIVHKVGHRRNVYERI